MKLSEIDWKLASKVSGSRKQAFKGSRYDGKVLMFADGSKYEGKLNNKNKRDGTGRMTWPDGLTYTGEFRNGLRHGHGVLMHRADLCQYKGDYENDLPHGYGTITWLDGTSFEG